MESTNACSRRLYASYVRRSRFFCVQSRNRSMISAAETSPVRGGNSGSSAFRLIKLMVEAEGLVAVRVQPDLPAADLDVPRSARRPPERLGELIGTYDSPCSSAT